MPRSLNRVTLLGHLGKDAEIKHTPSGLSVANFSIATERRWKDQQSGEWKSETDWHRIQAWRVDGVGQFLTKGKAVLVEGRLQTRSYDDKDGVKRYVTEVVAENLILLGAGNADSERSGQRGEAGSGRAAPQHPPTAPAASGGPFATDDDVPF